VFDAFTAVKRDDPLTVIWRDIEIPDDQRALLDELLSVMGYLGRAESWVEARCIDSAPVPDCTPGTEALDTGTGELMGELVTLYAPLPADAYQTLRNGFLTDKKAIKKLGATLPDTLLDALSVDTADLRKLGWSQPPAARKVSYLRPVDALRPRYTIHRALAPTANTVSFILIGKPLPRVEDSLRIGELMRQAVMGQCKRILGEDRIPPVFSGHGLPTGNRHRHAFYLPWDSNGDGRLDRIIVHAPDGMDAELLRVLAHVDRLWSRGGSQWRLVLEGSGDPSLADVITRPAVTWQSVTPYLHPWHVKKGFGIEDQLRRECRERGLSEPAEFEQLSAVPVGNQTRNAIRFQRFRSKRGLNQPDRHGSFWRMTFAEPVSGPMALGFGCHFGLGLFKPAT
jgi:CRISPR-associated protein Csb2